MEFVDRILNIFVVLPNDLQSANSTTLINAMISIAFFYFISRWFKAYIIRLVLFLFGISVFYEVLARDSYLWDFDFYGSIGLFVPHIEIVEITYLIIKEKTLFLYNQILALIFYIATPFIWLYNLFLKLFIFLKIKKEQRANEKAYKKYYQEEPEQTQEENNYYQEAKKEKQQQTKKEYTYKKEKKQEYKEEPKQETKQEQTEEKTYSRWDSSNPYEVLGINNEATQQEIKKAYKNLSKIYHPDLTLTNKDEHLIIFQKINNAYMILK